MSDQREMDAHDRFDVRAQSYSPARVGLFNQANRRYPEARATERALLIERLNLEPGLAICDVGAGGGYLAEGIDAVLPGECRILCVENSGAFLDSIDDRFDKILSSLCRIDLADAMVDRVSCLAGLHHQERKGDFFREAHRILRPGGRVVVADVLDGSPPAKFLNDSVDRYTDIGHDGMFLHPGELTGLMTEAGFDNASEQYEEYTWNFPDRKTMIWFCQTLFRMGKATPQQVEQEIDRYLQVTESPSGVHLHWSLIYANGSSTVASPTSSGPPPVPGCSNRG